MASKILVPVNGSECSLKAVDEAIRVARQSDALILLVNVQPNLNSYVSRFSSARSRDAMRKERAQKCLEEAQRRVRAAGIASAAYMLRGHIVPSLAEFAKVERVERIVMSTPRLEGLARWFKRPLADQVIRAVDVPVEVVNTGPASALERYSVPAGLGLGLTMVWLAAE